MRNVGTLLRTVAATILEGGADGVKRSVIGQRVRAPVSKLEPCLRYLMANDMIYQRDVPGNGWGQRGYTVYVAQHGITLDEVPPTVPPDYNMPDGKGLGLPRKPPRQAFNQGARCRLCDKILPTQRGGRPRQYCNIDCRGAYLHALSTQVGSMLLRTPPTRRHITAYHIVAADLASRSRMLLHPAEGPHDGFLYIDGKLRVDIFLAHSHEPHDYYQGDIEGDIRAVVKLDGRIEYTPPWPEEESAPTGDEPMGA